MIDGYVLLLPGLVKVAFDQAGDMEHTTCIYIRFEQNSEKHIRTLVPYTTVTGGIRGKYGTTECQTPIDSE